MSGKDLYLLKCPKCNALNRPHILWFDEYYNEEFYKFETAKNIGKETDILFVIGTHGAINLPNIIFHDVLQHDGLIIDINPNKNLFTPNIQKYENGYWVKEKSEKALLKIVKTLIEINNRFPKKTK